MTDQTTPGADAIEGRHERGAYKVINADCLSLLRGLPDNSIDSVVCDPPYGLSNTDAQHVAETITQWVTGNREYIPEGKGFMGKSWDAFVPPVAVWDECLRVLKPGGYVIAFAGSRTFDLMTLGIRLAGFDIRDSVAWLYGSGFPKGQNISKAIDKAAGVEFTASPASGVGFMNSDDDGWNTTKNRLDRSGESTPEAQKWEGWNTALKPAFEPAVVARKPFPGTVANNVLEHGTGAMNIDRCRINPGESVPGGGGFKGGASSRHEGWTRPSHVEGASIEAHTQGRWPANVVLDESQAAQLDQQSGESTSRIGKPRGAAAGNGWGMTATGAEYSDSGGASRFFYVAKASKRERPVVDGVAHPTVKPIALMEWLIRLVTPPGGVVLDPFAGSGTTVEAAINEGFSCIAVERDEAYMPLIEERVRRANERKSKEG